MLESLACARSLSNVRRTWKREYYFGSLSNVRRTWKREYYFWVVSFFYHYMPHTEAEEFSYKNLMFNSLTFPKVLNFREG